MIKLGDKICNVSEITPTEPAEWPLQRKLEYFDWAEKVVAGCRGCNAELEEHFDAVLKKEPRVAAPIGQLTTWPFLEMRKPRKADEGSKPRCGNIGGTRDMLS